MGALLAAVDRVLAGLLGGIGARLGAGIPQLDLHGLGVREALVATERFLVDAAASGAVEVRIVYGKGRRSPAGRGVLREVVPRWLAAEGRRWVESAAPEPDAHGEDGAIRVRLRAPDA